MILFIYRRLVPVAIFLSFLNFPILGILRTSDLIFISLSIFSVRYYKLISGFSLAVALHFFVAANLDDLNLFWFVKFLLTFAIFSVLDKYVKLDLNRSIALLKFSLILFISWVYIKLLLVSSGVISGSWRASFPASDYSSVDSHLYAQVLTILGLAFGLVTRLRSVFVKPHFFVLVSMVCFWFLANVLSSSRNGVAITTLVVIVCLLIVVFNVMFRGKVKVSYILGIGSFLSILIFILIQSRDFTDLSEIASLIKRSLGSLSIGDASTSVRLSELQNVVYDVDIWKSLFGVSIFNGRVGFYDGILTLSLAIFGTLLTGFVVISLILLIYFMISKKLYYTSSIIVVYCLQNLISEFVFVSRGAVFSFLAILVVFRTEQEMKRHNVAEASSGTLG